MKIPAWFVIGCGLLVLNLVLVVGGALSRRASAEPPTEQQKLGDQADDQISDGLTAADSPRLQDEAALAPTLPNQVQEPLPTVPSLENPNLATPTLTAPNIVSLKEVENAVAELQTSADLLAPLDAIMKDSSPPISEQLSQSYFESMKLRLKSVQYLNRSTAGLVEEAAILFQRGDIAEAQKLLGIATQLRETTARLLVTHP
jgi:hypothetical protein